MVAIDAAGVHTKGDANAAEDPWALGQSEIDGRVVASFFGLGWLIKALPMLVVGGALIWWATARWASYRWRPALRIVGFSLLVSVVAYVLRPFVNQILIGATRDADGLHAAVISTGVLPIRVQARTGGFVDLIDGRTGTLTTQLPEGADGVWLDSRVHMGFWWWVLMIAVWITPFAVSVWLVGRERRRRNRSGPNDPAGSERSVSETTETTDDQPTQVIEFSALQALLATAGTGEPSTDPLDDRTARSNRRRGHHRRRPVHRKPLVVIMSLGLIGGLFASTGTTAGAFASKVNNTTNNVASNPFFTCTSAGQHSGAYLAWPLGDNPTQSGANAADVSGNGRAGTYGGSPTRNPLPGCKRDTNGTMAVKDPNDDYVYYPTTLKPPTESTMTIWFQTTSRNGGRLMGFSNSKTGASSASDRNLWLSNAGLVVFGVNSGTVKTTINSPLAYADGKWHQAVASLSATAGMTLYVDGVQVATNAAVKTATNANGYWRVGWDDLSSWGTFRPISNNLTGNLAFAAVYTSPLPASQIPPLYWAGI